MLYLKTKLGFSLAILAISLNCHSQYFSLNPVADKFLDNNEFDSALFEFNIGLKKAILSKDTAAVLHNLKGQMHVWRTIEEEVDLNKLKNQITSWRKTDTSNYYYRAVSVFGMYLYDLGKIRKCISYYDSLIIAEPKIKADYFIYAGILSCMGDAYFDLGQYEKALNYYNNSISLYRSIENQYEVKRVRKHIASVYLHNGQEEEGLNIKRGYLADTTLNAHDRAILYNNIAISHVNMGNPDSAIYYYNKTKELADVHKRTNLQNTVLNNLSHALEDKIALQEEKVKNRGLQRNILLLVLVIGLLVGAIAIYTLITRIKNMKILAAEKEKRHQQELANIIDQSEMQSLAAQMQAMKVERSRVANDLHDRLGGMMGGLRISFDQLANNIAEKHPEFAEPLDKATSMLNESCDEIRSVSHNLAISSVSQFGLIESLRKLVGRLNESSRVKIALESDAEKLKIESEAEMEIYKVVQEALMNIIKHAKAKNVEIHIGIIDEEFQVIIEDDGKGFDIENTENGLGMSNMQGRIEKLKGKLTIDSKIGRGTSIIAEIPYKELI